MRLKLASASDIYLLFIIGNYFVKDIVTHKLYVHTPSCESLKFTSPCCCDELVFS